MLSSLYSVSTSIYTQISNYISPQTNKCIFAPENKYKLDELMTKSINHPAIPTMLSTLTNNHICDGNEVTYHAPVIKGVLMSLCENGKNALGEIHPLNRKDEPINFDLYKVAQNSTTSVLSYLYL